jgi:hypothetical protein
MKRNSEPRAYSSILVLANTSNIIRDAQAEFDKICNGYKTCDTCPISENLTRGNFSCPCELLEEVSGELDALSKFANFSVPLEPVEEENK